MSEKKKKTSELFNEKYRSESMYYGWKLRRYFTDYFNQTDLHGRRALDLGCGEGKYSIYLAKLGAKVTAVDVAEEGIKKLRKLASRDNLSIDSHVLDLQSFEFFPDTFDVIIAPTVLGHLSAWVRKYVVSGIKKALKAGGVLYVSVFTQSDPGFAGNEKMSENEKRISETAGAVHYYFSTGELKEIFSELQILHYYEGKEPDFSHGAPHLHGWASLLARKPGDGEFLYFL